MQCVFVVNANRQPLAPCHPARARELLDKHRAVVLRRFPFTLMLKQSVTVMTPTSYRLKIDPGSKTTGLVIVDRTNTVIWAAELYHRGYSIEKALKGRRELRRGRRTRKTRYRPARWRHRVRAKDWFQPSLISRVHNVLTWVSRLRRVCPITALSLERVKFDTQKLINPEIDGVEYQRGELFGYEVREYLLEKWGRKCAYCGAKNVPIQIEHVVPRSRGGSDRVSNLATACRPCNQKKGNQTAAEFGFPSIHEYAQRPIKDVAAVNTTRNVLYRRLDLLGLPIETGSGGMTKHNRLKANYPKTHWIDAACVGSSGATVKLSPDHRPLIILAKGHGNRQMCQTDKFGFPIRHKTRLKKIHGWQTGDMARAIVPPGLKTSGTHVGRIVKKARGSFGFTDMRGRDIGAVNHKYLKPIHRNDGYAYRLTSDYIWGKPKSAGKAPAPAPAPSSETSDI